ncbi:hypothetical protein GGR50DRAFT_431250 [Xylaria sp. CBS 124048]|nr:hypothetical protein GGR50DRAFT_431250 [Xylaria sp. CBS 124048]
MNFIRTSLLGRGQAQAQQQTPQPEHQRHADVEAQGHDGPRLSATTRPPLPGSSLVGRLSVGTRGRRVEDDEAEEDGSKTPSLTRIHPPSLMRFRTQDILGQTSSSQDATRASTSLSRLSTASGGTRAFPALPRPSAARRNGEPDRRARRSRFSGLNLEELHLAGLAEGDRRRQYARNRQGDSQWSRRRPPKDPPTRFLFCLPWVKSRQARSLILRCFVSGILVVVTLTIFLSLSLTKKINTNEFSILLIVLILLATIFFCHSLVRLCMILVWPRNGSGHGSDSNGSGQFGYTIPQLPIRVLSAGDEEDGGNVSEAVQLKPPAYGQWRESVRVDPSRFYWQRAEPLPSSQPISRSSTDQYNTSEEASQAAQHRPPSYTSDEGVDYIIDVRPRSIAPPLSSVYSQSSMMETVATSNITDIPLLPHPGVRDTDTVVSGPGSSVD